MKTLDKLNKELSELMDTDKLLVTPIELGRIRERIQFVKMCIAYLETNPSESFIRDEVDRLQNRAKLIDEAFKVWANSTNDTFISDKQKKDFYNKEMGLPKITQQVKALKFLIN